jgi:FixJ family two-component response regulator
LPGQSGLDFQGELTALNVPIPIIFITAHSDIPMCVQAMKDGAIGFLTKPCHNQDLIDAVHHGLIRDRARRQNEKALSALRARFGTLSPREREIMIQVVQGRISKQIADAEDERPLAARTLSNSGQAQAVIREDVSGRPLSALNSQAA